MTWPAGSVPPNGCGTSAALRGASKVSKRRGRHGRRGPRRASIAPTDAAPVAVVAVVIQNPSEGLRGPTASRRGIVTVSSFTGVQDDQGPRNRRLSARPLERVHERRDLGVCRDSHVTHHNMQERAREIGVPRRRADLQIRHLPEDSLRAREVGAVRTSREARQGEADRCQRDDSHHGCTGEPSEVRLANPPVNGRCTVRGTHETFDYAAHVGRQARTGDGAEQYSVTSRTITSSSLRYAESVNVRTQTVGPAACAPDTANNPKRTP